METISEANKIRTILQAKKSVFKTYTPMVGVEAGHDKC